MDFGTLMNRLGRNGQVFVGAALLLFIDGFLPWYKVSWKGGGDLAAFGSTSASGNAWSVGFGAWFPTLLALAAGAVVVLAAMGSLKWAPLLTWTIGTAVAIVATIIILLRWLTYPSVDGIAKAYVDAGASFGTYIGLVLGVVMAVFGYLAFAASGGNVANIGAAFQNQPAAQPNQQYNPYQQGGQQYPPQQGGQYPPNNQYPPQG